MAAIAQFTFNGFAENTFILHDDTKECVIFDPGCSSAYERKELTDFITQYRLKPVRLVNTHCHIDHIFGNKYIGELYNLPLELHLKDLPVLQAGQMVAQAYGLEYDGIIDPPYTFLQEGTQLNFGNTSLEILFTPGHSPGSISFYSEADKFVLAGDVLFNRSIGRTDLPGGDMQTLVKSIQEQLFSLPNETEVYCGHGEATTIGEEKEFNPFVGQHSAVR